MHFIAMEDKATQGFLLLRSTLQNSKAEDNTVSTTDGLTITGAEWKCTGNIRTHTNFDAFGASVDIKDLGNAAGTVAVLDLNENAHFLVSL